jgi:hypothetical protein
MPLERRFDLYRDVLYYKTIIYDFFDFPRGQQCPCVMLQKKEIENYLSDKYQHVRNVRVHVKSLPHYSKIIYAPVYVLRYRYGEKINIHGEKLPNNFCALLNATGEMNLHIG